MLGKTKLYLLIVIVALYVVMPVVAGAFVIGDKWGPKIYPVALHEPLYAIGWRVTHPNGRKPRVGLWYKKAYRPWFYGMYSRNEDPLKIRKTIGDIERAIVRD